MKQRFSLSLAILVALAFSVKAQTVPQGINYQCIVRNNQTGDPITNQTVTLLFSIRSGSPNGLVDYQEKQVGSTNEFGLVNLVIGRGQAQVNTFTGINWGAGSKFLTVLLETTPNVFDEIGNSELLSVPYALYAQNGGSSGGSDNWGSQTAFTNNGLVGNGLANNPIGLAPQGAQSGQVLKWNGTAWSPADDLLSTGTNGGTVTQINTGVGLTGGPISTTGTISLNNTGVQPGTHGSATEIPVITVDAQGRISNVTKVIVQPGSVGLNDGTGIDVVTNGFNNFTINNTGDTNANDDVTLTTAHDGDASGPYNNLQLKANVVTSNELNNGAVTAAKLANMGAANGQVLKWNGNAWAPGVDDSGNVSLTEGAGIDVTGNSPNFTITNTGDTNGADDITTASQANGDVSGPFNNLQIKANAVTAAEINDGAVGTADLANQAVTGAKIDDMNAANGQVLKWNGTTWAPAADGGGSFDVIAGAGIDVNQNGDTFTVINTGDKDATDDLINTSVFNGDVTGPFNNLQLKAGIVANADMAANSIGTNNLINGAVTAAKLNTMGAANGQVLQYNGMAWAPVTLPAAAGDDWGTQNAQTNATLSGNGTAGAPLGIAQQGAVNGQYLRWNGTAWVPGTLNIGAALAGNGTIANPLNLAQQGANVGEVLKWNGANWLPSADNSSGTGDTYSAGPGITVTGASPNFTINNAGDLSNVNELQNLSIAGNTLSISNGNAVNLPVGPTYTAGAGISLAGNVVTNTGDLSNTNELQDISLTGSVLEISNGSAIDLAPLLGSGGDNWAKQGNHISNSNTGNVLIGTNVSTTGKLQVINGDAGNEAGRFVQTGGTQPAVFGQSSAGAGGFFTSDNGPALLTGTGNVGIGAAIPAARLHIFGNGESVRLQGNTPSIMFIPGVGNVGGYARLVNGQLSLGTTDFSNVGITPNGRPALIANGANGYIGIGEVNLTDAMVRIAHKEEGLRLENLNNNNFWGFTSSPLDNSLILSNSALLGGPAGVFQANGAYLQISDRRLKTDIQAINSSIMGKIMQLQPKTYRYTAEAGDAKRSVGFLAQDMERLFPELVGEIANLKEKKTFLSINYSGLSVLAIKAIQEQQTEIEALKAENEALRKQTESLEARMLRLEKLIEGK